MVDMNMHLLGIVGKYASHSQPADGLAQQPRVLLAHVEEQLPMHLLDLSNPGLLEITGICVATACSTAFGT